MARHGPAMTRRKDTPTGLGRREPVAQDAFAEPDVSPMMGNGKWAPAYKAGRGFESRPGVATRWARGLCRPRVCAERRTDGRSVLTRGKDPVRRSLMEPRVVPATWAAATPLMRYDVSRPGRNGNCGSPATIRPMGSELYRRGQRLPRIAGQMAEFRGNDRITLMRRPA